MGPETKTFPFIINPAPWILCIGVLVRRRKSIKSSAIYFGFSRLCSGREAQRLGLVDPAIAIIVSLGFLVLLLYKRVNLGIVLNATALLLALLAINWVDTPKVIYNTTDTQTFDGRLAISVVLATFVIMLLSQLYKETGVINDLSESIGRIINNPKLVMGILPAVMGFLPVSGGALMSAPLVDLEAEKLKLEPDRKAYINLWFRHTVFPVYPISQPLIVTAGLTGVVVPLIVLRQIPVVIVMVIAGYIIGFWKISGVKNKESSAARGPGDSDSRDFLVAFSPILVTVIAAVVLDAVGLGLAQQGIDVLIATMIGLIALVIISRLSLSVFARPFRGWGIYGITFTAYGAFLLRNVMVSAGISGIFKPFVSNGSIDVILLLTVAPAVLGPLTGSPQGGVALSVSILYGIVAFTPKVASLIYISAYLGYTIAPTHLCFTFTADYFKCSLGKIYKYVIPSFLITFPVALLVYFLF
jgi:integral membrane protein (TIGR00529 family)